MLETDSGRPESRSQESADRLERRVRSDERGAVSNRPTGSWRHSPTPFPTICAPLRSIDGFSLALLEDFSEQLDAEAKSYLNRVRAACRRMARASIDDLLALLSRVTRFERWSGERGKISAPLVRSEASDARQSQPDPKLRVHDCR